jgi:hypothetical protein
MNDPLLSGILQSVVGAIVGGIISYVIARQQNRSQLELVRHQADGQIKVVQEHTAAQTQALTMRVEAYQKQIADQRQWDAMMEALPLLATILARIDPDDHWHRPALSELRHEWAIGGKKLYFKMAHLGLAGNSADRIDKLVRDYLEALGKYQEGKMLWDALDRLRLQTRDALVGILTVHSLQSPLADGALTPIHVIAPAE